MLERFFGNDKNDERVHAESRLQKHWRHRHQSWHSQERHSKRPHGSAQRKITIVTMRRVFKRLILRYDLCRPPRIWKIVLLATMVISPKIE